MAFQIKDFRSIVASMLNRMRGTTRKITDLSKGSVARTLVEAPAQEMEELYQQTFLGIQEALPSATFRTFDFALLEATQAGGVVRVTIVPIAQDTLIPAGSLFTREDAQGVTYTSTADVLIAALDSFGDVPVRATSAGSAGNAPSGTAFTMSSAPQGLVSAQASGALANGNDGETEAQRKDRFRAFINTLARATPAALIYGAKTTRLYDAQGVESERVATASVVEPYVSDPLETPGLVHLFVHNGTTGTSGPLVARALEIVQGYTDPTTGRKVPGWKAAGVQVLAFAATEQAVNVVGVLTAKPGYTVAALIPTAQAVTAAYVRSIPLIGDEPVGLRAADAPNPGEFQRAELIRRVKSITGVDNFTLATPSADVLAMAGTKLVPGTIAYT